MSDFVWKPTDPVVLRARQIVCEQMHDRDKGPGSFCEFVEAGLRDDCPEMRIAVAALREPRPEPTVWLEGCTIHTNPDGFTGFCEEADPPADWIPEGHVVVKEEK